LTQTLNLSEMTMEITKLLKQYSETPGPSGFEQRIGEVVLQSWQPLADDVFIDRLGNVIASKEGSGSGPRPKLLLAAHIDEIGLMVKKIVTHHKNGFLRVTKVGGVDIRHLYGQTVIVHGQRDFVGVIGSLPDAMLPASRRRKPFGFEDLVIDPGLPSKDIHELVNVGDFVSFRQPFRKMISPIVTGKALDNRASVAALTLCLDYLQNRGHTWDLICVGTAQEETRLLGAFTSSFAQIPDAAVAIDVTFAKGPGLTDNNAFELGSGPALEIGPNVHPGMYKTLQEAAKALEMKTSTSLHVRASGTDAFGIQVSRSGIPTGLVSIPLRYMHTMVETIHTADVARAGRLLGEFAARLDKNFLENLAKAMLDEK